MSFLRSALHLAAALALLAFAAPASAVDGVIEINPASAAAGVGLGDAPGFPVTLALRGSYRLTGELNVPPNTTAIVFQNDQITLDLNGFSIAGGGGTSGFGIQTASDLTRGQRVLNGVIRNMAAGGIRLGDDAVVDGVTVIDSGGIGIRVRENGRILDSQALDSGGVGISAARGSLVSGSTASGNGSVGIDVTSSVVDQCIANDNGSHGIEALGTGSVHRSYVRGNASNGILADSGPIVGNTAIFNDGIGINLSPAAGYAQNVASENGSGSGDQISGGIPIGLNACSGTTSCP